MVDPNRKINLLPSSEEDSEEDLNTEQCATIKKFEESFANRFTETDEVFMEFCKLKAKPPPVIYPFDPSGFRRNHHHRGGFGGGNRYHRGGGGGFQHRGGGGSRGNHHYYNPDRRNNQDGGRDSNRYRPYNANDRSHDSHKQQQQ